MSRTSSARRSPASIRSTVTDRYSPSGLRVLAVAFGGLLAGSYLRVFYHVADVAGGVRWLVLGVGAALVLATLAARLTTVRTGAVAGGLFAIVGVAIYVAHVPAIHDDLFTVAFVRRWLRYLTGVSVLGFRRVDLWAIVVAPGPAFLSGLLLLRRRYDGAALVGGLMLGFFAMTGDADQTTTLVGMVSLLALLGVGTLEREAGTWREVKQIGFVVTVAVLVTRWIRFVPDDGVLASGGTDDVDAPMGHSLDGNLENAADRANIHESISLSPTVLFTIEADEAAYWHVVAYDRYTGSDWIRTGGTRPYEGPLDSPPGETTRNEQTVAVESSVGTLPAAWKPIEVHGVDPGRVEVTDLGGLVPANEFEPPETYRVTSEVPPRRRETGRDAGSTPGTADPDRIRDRYLQLPESTSDRVRRLAEEIAGDAESTYDVAISIRRWLLLNKSYEVDVERPQGDVVEGFLFSMDGGYCVYFATAMTVMLRVLGVPARFVLGYTTGQRVGDGRWVVRGLDSHAWVEVYRPGVGWTRYDPTPENFRVVVRRSILGRARQRDVEGVDTNESRRVSAATEGARFGTAPGDVTEEGTTPAAARGDSGLAESAPNATTGSPPASDDPSSPGRDDSVARWLEGRDRLDLLAGAVGVALGLHWTGALERGYRSVRLRWQRPTESPRDDVERAYERLELLLGRRFRPRRPDETRRQYVELAEGIVDDERAHRVVDLFERASYAGTASRTEADEAIRLVDELVGDDR